MLWLGFIQLSILLQISSVVSLRCYFCVSYTSWEHCTSKQIKQTCNFGPIHNTCIEWHRKKVLLNGRKVQEFTRSCYHKKHCTRDSCFDTDTGTVTWCDMQCCNTTLCNQMVKSTPPKNSTAFSKPAISGSHTSKPINTIPRNPTPTRFNYSNFSRKDVNPFTPRPAVIFRKSSENVLTSVFFVTVAMVALSVVVARQQLFD